MMKKAAMARIVNDLREEHGSFAKLYDILEGQLQIFQDNEVPDYDLIGDIIDLLFQFPYRFHHPKEDAIFEKLGRRDPSAVSGMPDLEREHGKLQALTKQFASNIDDVLSEVEMPRDEVMKNLHKLANFQRHHMQMEESIFLPAALKSLTPEDWKELDARAGDPDDPTFGAAAKAEFSTNCEKVLRSR